MIMAAPLPDAVKEEDEGNMDSFQSGQTIIGQDDFMAIFRNDKPLCELLMKIGQRTSGSSGAKPAAPPPVRVLNQLHFNNPVSILFRFVWINLDSFMLIYRIIVVDYLPHD